MIFWKTGKCVKNILIDLSPFSCLASEPTLSEHSSHTFTTFPIAKPFCPWSTFVCWVLNTKLANCKLQFYFTQYLQGKSANLSRYRKYFVNDYPREKIYIFLFNSPWLHKMSRQHWSTQLQDAGVPDFFFPCLQDLFLVLVGHFVYLFCDVVSQDCLIFVTAGALVVLRI